MTLAPGGFAMSDDGGRFSARAMAVRAGKELGGEVRGVELSRPVSVGGACESVGVGSDARQVSPPEPKTVMLRAPGQIHASPAFGHSISDDSIATWT